MSLTAGLPNDVRPLKIRLVCVGLYSVVEKEGFIHMLQTAELQFDMPSHKFLTETAVPQLYQETKRKVASALNWKVICLFVKIRCWFFHLTLPVPKKPHTGPRWASKLKKDSMWARLTLYRTVGADHIPLPLSYRTQPTTTSCQKEKLKTWHPDSPGQQKPYIGWSAPSGGCTIWGRIWRTWTWSHKRGS